FRHLVCLRAYLLPEVLVRWQVRHIDAGTVGVELPAMIDAADAASLVSAIEQRCAAMRAAMVHYTDTPRCIAERDQPLAQQHQTQRLAARRHLRRTRSRQPVLPDQVAHHGARTNASQLLAFGGVCHPGFSLLSQQFAADKLRRRSLWYRTAGERTSPAPARIICASGQKRLYATGRTRCSNTWSSRGD